MKWHIRGDTNAGQLYEQSRANILPSNRIRYSVEAVDWNGSKIGGCSHSIPGSAARTGDWSNVANWSAGVPTSASDVVIPAGVTVTASNSQVDEVARTITTDPTATLFVNGGFLKVEANSTIAGDLNLSNGIIEADPGATLTIAGANNQWTGTVAGSFAGSGSGVIQVNQLLSIGSPNATFNFPLGMFQWSAGMMTGEGLTPSVLTNLGTITVTGNQSKTLEDVTLNNSGTILDSGTSTWIIPNLNGGKLTTIINNLAGGVIDMSSSETFQLRGPGFTSLRINNNSGATFEITGPGGTENVPFNNQGGAVVATAGTVMFGAGGTDTGGIYDASAGATIILGSSGIETTTFTGLYSGSGAGTVSIGNTSGIIIGGAGATFDFDPGLLNWSGGGIGGTGFTSNPSVLTNTGSITLSGGTTKFLANGLTLANSGTIVDDGTNGGSWAFSNYAVLNNLNGGVLEFAGTETVAGDNSRPPMSQLTIKWEPL